jgi:hypothetical protein
VTGKQLMDLLKARLSMPDVALRGYVLDNIPPKDFDPRVLRGVKAARLDFIFEIRMDEEEALANVSKFGIDLESGMLYSDADLTPGDHQPLVPAQNPEDPNAGPLLNEDGTTVMVCCTQKRWNTQTIMSDQGTNCRLTACAFWIATDAHECLLTLDCQMLFSGICLRFPRKISARCCHMCVGVHGMCVCVHDMFVCAEALEAPRGLCCQAGQKSL